MSKAVIDQKTREYQKLLAEAKKIQDQYHGSDMPPSVGAEFNKKTDEAIALKGEIQEHQRKDKLDDLDGFLHEMPEGPLPLPGSSKSNGTNEPVGFLSIGDKFIESDGFLGYATDKPSSGSVKMAFEGASWQGERSLIPLTAKSYRERSEKMESKALPTLSTSDATTFAVISPQRLPEVLRTYELPRLTLRDLVAVRQTNSNAVEITRITSALPTAATTVSDALTGGSTKPESTLSMGVAQVPIRTLAVHMPVTEQQLEDLPQIRSIINEDLRFDIVRLEEYQMVWGDGTGTDMLGIMETPNVGAFTRTPELGAGTTVTILDKIRGAMTDIQVNNLEPDGVLMHPIDFEELVLQKGTDDHYLRQIFPTEDGGNRVFSLRIVVSLAAEAYRSGLSALQRVVLVGAFRSGAVLFDRHQVAVEVGYIDKQFIQNTRTIRAEERVGFGVVRPLGFKYIETVAAGT